MEKRKFVRRPVFAKKPSTMSPGGYQYLPYFLYVEEWDEKTFVENADLVPVLRFRDLEATNTLVSPEAVGALDIPIREGTDPVFLVRLLKEGTLDPLISTVAGAIKRDCKDPDFRAYIATEEGRFAFQILGEMLRRMPDGRWRRYSPEELIDEVFSYWQSEEDENELREILNAVTPFTSDKKLEELAERFLRFAWNNYAHVTKEEVIRCLREIREEVRKEEHEQTADAALEENQQNFFPFP